MNLVRFPAGEWVPALGQGTWRMGEEAGKREEEVAALRLGLDLGMTLIDTAEMYRGAEDVVAEAIRGRRDECFLVDKVLPGRATRRGAIAACEHSLRRLETDRIDLYLLHWRGAVPLEETVAAFEELIDAGKIRYWGVSNFDRSDMEDLMRVAVVEPQTNQVLYNPVHRGVEWDLLPWCRERAMPIMAYSPIEQGALRDDGTLQRVAARHRATPAQIALAWVLRQPDVITIPKAGTRAHVRENHRALALRLTARDLRDLDGVFAPPSGAEPLAVL